jgi:NAD-dependent SIR2 family protein deacetylase
MRFQEDSSQEHLSHGERRRRRAGGPSTARQPNVVDRVVSPEATWPQPALPVRFRHRATSPDHRPVNLQDFIADHPRLLALTGAGISTASGIPDYRDATGAWKRAPPMTWQAFTGAESARQRYWARSSIGWPWINQAQPNDAHRALARLESRGGLSALITQNVDGLHQKAGHQRVIDLHGRLDQVVCLQCHRRTARSTLQQRLLASNPGWSSTAGEIAPDGDADLDAAQMARFVVPPCDACGGMLKPDVVFYGESVPRDRVQQAFAAVDAADALLIVGSSLMVYSGFRFARRAADLGLPIAAINLGQGRADDLLSLRVTEPADRALAFLLD